MHDFQERDIKFLEIGIDYLDLDEIFAVMPQYSPCLGVVPGVHPKLITVDSETEEIFKFVENRISLYRKYVQGVKTGLDYHWVEDEAAQQNQRILLKQFIEYAEDEKLPVVLHIRSNINNPFKAEYDLFTLLSELHFTGKMIVHCFCGNSELVFKYLSLNRNTYFGIGGTITYPDCTDLEEAVKVIPRDRLLLETDGPYIKPFFPDRTRPIGKRNSSFNLPIVIKKLANVLGQEPQEIEDMTAKNAMECFSIV